MKRRIQHAFQKPRAASLVHRAQSNKLYINKKDRKAKTMSVKNPINSSVINYYYYYQNSTQSTADTEKVVLKHTKPDLRMKMH